MGNEGIGPRVVHATIVLVFLSSVVFAQSGSLRGFDNVKGRRSELNLQLSVVLPDQKITVEEILGGVKPKDSLTCVAIAYCSLPLRLIILAMYWPVGKLDQLDYATVSYWNSRSIGGAEGGRTPTSHCELDPRQKRKCLLFRKLQPAKEN